METLAPINPAERQWLDKNVNAIETLITRLRGDGTELTPETLDIAFEAWLSSHDRDEQDPNPMIDAFGAAFGQYLADHLDLEWKIATEGDGHEMALHGQPGDIMLYPPNLVAKRYVDGETGFFAPVFEALENQINAIRKTS